VPGSIEAYYQEAGRAGRDGAPARCLLFACARDKGLHVFFIERSEIDDGAFGAVARRLLAQAPRAAAGGAPGGAPATAVPSPAAVIRFDAGIDELAAGAACEADAVRAVVGHLARAGVLQPAPAAPDRVAGRVTGAWDAAALAACRAAASDAVRARWRQYRAVWAFVEDRRCRRAAILRHFGDAADPAPHGACCDVCDPGLRPASPAPPAAPGGGGLRQLAHRPEAGTRADAALDDAILEVVASADPPVGRTRAVEILRGGRSKVVVRHAYDGLPHYGTFGHLRGEAVLERIDALVGAGTLRSSGGRFPKLELA
jgi:ATP-dependent DNA helicase RecQ